MHDYHSISKVYICEYSRQKIIKCHCLILPFNLFQIIVGFGFPDAEQGRKIVSPDNASLSEGVTNHTGGTKKNNVRRSSI